MARQIKPSLLCANIRNISEPYLIRSGRLKLLIQQVRRNRHIVIRISRSLVFLLLDTFNAKLIAYPSDPALSSSYPLL
jgi:hypothetical protein